MNICRTDLLENTFLSSIYSAQTDEQEKLMRSRSFHTGLWFDKYLIEQKGSTLEPYAKHITLTSKIKEPSTYKAFFDRWKAELEKMGMQIREAKVVGRLAAGLGGESVIENGLTFHHTYGVPIIPGSSLKGTARAYAAANLDGVWAEKGAAFRTLFGGQSLLSEEDDSDDDKRRKKARVGIAVFYDALPIPGTFHIHNEVMTVHHKKYYQDGSKPPADWDSPTPIPFPAVSGTFLIALHAPAAPEWATSGMGILKMALKEIGVGGKTSSGFGRFNVPLSPEEQQLEEQRLEKQHLEKQLRKRQHMERKRLDSFYKALNNLPNSHIAGQINNFVNRWRSGEIPQSYKQEVAQAILDKVHTAGRKKKSQDKRWYLALQSCVQDNACPD